MSLLRSSADSWRAPLVALFVALLLALVLADAAHGARKSHRRPAPPEPEPAWTTTPDAPPVADTPTNLQVAFTNELNTRERYLAFATQAANEGHAGVARLFRACARAESVHARRDVQAIAVTGQPARAVLDRVTCGTTAQNLQVAIGCEGYEVRTWYPALIARARADGQGMAVRSLTLALGAERGHLALFEAALAKLGAQPLASLYYVCSYCGRTTESLPGTKCPGCFTSRARFLRSA